MNKKPLSAFASIAFAVLATQSLSAATILPRENITVFSQDPAKLEKLRAAVEALKARGVADSTSWFDLAAIHGIPAGDPKLSSIPAPIKALFDQCHNDDALFFLWHRAYVAALEHLMQDAIKDPDFRLPYWDWYAQPELPEAFRSKYLDAKHTKKNSLFMPNRNQGLSTGKSVWSPVIGTNFDNPDFASFQSQLNFGEHGSIHIGVGKGSNMGNIQFAARDPIFFLHHANIDRLLTVWLKRNPTTHTVPSAFQAWDPAVYRFPTPGGGVATPTVQALALGSMEMMGYNYDNNDQPHVASPPLPPRPAIIHSAAAPANPTESKRLTFAAVKAGEKPIQVGAGGTVEINIEPVHRERINALLSTPTQPAEGLAIVLDNVRALNLPPGVLSYRVFVNLPKEASNNGFRDHFVGNISLFALQHAAAMHGRATVTLPLSAGSGGAALKEALASGETASHVGISVIPELAPGAVVPKAPALLIDQVRLVGSIP